MPAIGLGTFGSDHVSHHAVADAVKYAASIGYRHFDCASVYGNEERIGHVFRELFQNGLRRDEDLDHLKALERQARRKRRDPLVREIAGRSCNSTTSISIWSTGRSPIIIRPDATYGAQSACRALHPRELHAHLAQDGGTRRSRAGAPHRHVEHDDPEDEAAAARRADQAGRQRDGASSPLSAAGVFPLPTSTTEFSQSVTRRSARRHVRSAIARPKTHRRQKIR